MDMPREIRNQILELCLLVDGTINPYPAIYEDKDHFANCNRTPDVALLKVNKVLNFEATDIFYSMNTWQLSSPRPLDLQPFKKDLMWNLHRGRICHLRILMDMRDVPADTILKAARMADDRLLRGDQRTIFIHDHGLRGALETRRWKLMMKNYIKPLTLEIDMKHMYCPTGCCRDEFIDFLGVMIRRLLYMDQQHRLYGPSSGPTRDLNVIGLTNGEESNLIRRIWKQASSPSITTLTEPATSPERRLFFRLRG